MSGEAMGGQVGGADRDIGVAPAGDDRLGDRPADRPAPEHRREIRRTWHRAPGLWTAVAATDKVDAIRALPARAHRRSAGTDRQPAAS